MSQSENMDFSTLLAASVHDMKNSIGLLQQLVEQLSAEVGPDSKAAGQLSLEASRLNNYLIQLMTLYKLEQDQYRSVLAEHYLDDFLEDLLLNSTPQLVSRGIRAELQVEPELCWEFDSQLVSGTLNTVLTNLLRFAGERVRVSARRYSPETETGEGRNIDTARPCLLLQIEDDGEGFPQTMLGRLDRVSMGVDFVSGSTGFGLYFAHQVAQLHRNEEHQGYVELSNGGALGGACFRLCLP